MGNDQLLFLVRKLWQDKQELLKWSRSQNKEKLTSGLIKEIELLKEIEKRLG